LAHTLRRLRGTLHPPPRQTPDLARCARALTPSPDSPAPAPPGCQAAPGEVKYTAVGRRKTATAKVYIVPGALPLRWHTAFNVRLLLRWPLTRASSGTGVITMNGKPVVEYLGYNPAYVAAVRDPLEILGLDAMYDVIVKAHGGGVMGQAEAARLGISRALCEMDMGNRPALKAEGFMTRDPRAVERKKYGLKKARKAGQYSKR
jgi:small subunit ribosomal protein S9